MCVVKVSRLAVSEVVCVCCEGQPAGGVGGRVFVCCEGQSAGGVRGRVCVL